MRSLRLAFVFWLIINQPCMANPRNVATGPFAEYVDPGGSDANNGLTFATAKQHLCAAISDEVNNWDFAGNIAYVFASSNYTYNEACNISGALIGTTAILIFPSNPSSPSVPLPNPFNLPFAINFTWSCSYIGMPSCGAPPSAPAPQACLSLSDGGVAITGNITFAGCNPYNMVGGAAIKQHNYSVVDASFVFTGTIFSGSGNNDAAILADGPSIVTVANGAVIEGRYHYVYQMNRGGNATISGLQKFLGNAFVDGIYAAYSNSNFNLGASYDTLGAYSIGPSLYSGGSNIIGGSGIPGGISAGPSGLCGVMC
jgi:hypothetical protein